MTNSMWVTLHFFSLPCSLIAFHPMTNRKWVTLHFFLYHAVSLHSIPLVCEWHFIFSLPCSLILWPTVCGWHTALFSLPCKLISFHPMANRQWGHCIFLFTMQSHCISSLSISSHDQQYASDTAFLLFTMESHCISSHDQQVVSDTTFFLYHAVSLSFIPWPTGSEWHCIIFFTMQSHCFLFTWPTVCEWHSILFFTICMQSHCVSFHGQQGVSGTAFFLYHAVSLNFIPQPIVCESHFIFFFIMQSHCISIHGQQRVRTLHFFLTLHFCSLPCTPIGFHPMTNRQWVALHFLLYHALSLHFIPWQTGCE